MIERDEHLRNAITDVLTKTNVDARNLAVEVVDGSVTVKGTVPTRDALERVRHLFLEGGRLGGRGRGRWEWRRLRFDRSVLRRQQHRHPQRAHRGHPG